MHYGISPWKEPIQFKRLFLGQRMKVCGYKKACIRGNFNLDGVISRFNLWEGVSRFLPISHMKGAADLLVTKANYYKKREGLGSP